MGQYLSRGTLVMTSTMNKTSLGRRRALQIFAAAGSLLWLPSARASVAASEVFTWRGTALGAEASLTFHHVSESEGQSLVRRIKEEIQRLERVFSLYRADSTISLLNSSGQIDDPPLDLIRLLSQARSVSEYSGGAFDVTVQPLWQAYAAHFRSHDANASRPSSSTIESALELVGYAGIDIGSRAIALRKPGMALTLNGIAQGYITDRIADLLHAEGLRHVLIDLGEIRALDNHPQGRPWSIGLQDPVRLGGITEVIDIENQAVATSAGSGTRFDDQGLHHHIFNPHSGLSSGLYNSLSVAGKRATLADALSTGLYNLEPDDARDALAHFPGYSAHVVYANGDRQIWG